MIGVNNRNLKTLETSIQTTIELAPHVPPDRLLVTESGIRDHADLVRLAEVSAHCLLVGESLLRQPDIAAATRAHCSAILLEQAYAFRCGWPRGDGGCFRAKLETARTATARVSVRMQPETLAVIQAGTAAKGDVLGTARLAGIMAAKRTRRPDPSLPSAVDHGGNGRALGRRLSNRYRRDGQDNRTYRRRDGSLDCSQRCRPHRL